MSTPTLEKRGTDTHQFLTFALGLEEYGVALLITNCGECLLAGGGTPRRRHQGVHLVHGGDPKKRRE